jgi:hypothetical protein
LCAGKIVLALDRNLVFSSIAIAGFKGRNDDIGIAALTHEKTKWNLP